MAELSTRERALLEDAASWRLIGLAFERPRAGWAETLRAIAKERAVDETIAALAESAAREGSEAEFLATFGPGGIVSPREVSYRFMGDPGRILAELKVMYDTFAYMPVTEESPDHVSVEVGFVGFLRLKEAYALMMGDEEPALVIREASEFFISEHLVYLAAGIAGRLGDGYMADASDELVRRVGPVPAEIASVVEAAREGGDIDDCGSGCAFGTES